MSANADGLPGQVAVITRTARLYVQQLEKLHIGIGDRIAEMKELLHMGEPKKKLHNTERKATRPMVITMGPSAERKQLPEPSKPIASASHVNGQRYKAKRHPDRKAQEHTLALIAENGSVTASKVASTFKCTIGAARERLKKLVRTGLVEGPLDARETYRGVPRKQVATPEVHAP